MTKPLYLLIAAVSIIAPTLHLVSDVMEWFGGFSSPQLWINFAAFVMMPFMAVGLYAIQLPKIGRAGLLGAVLYGGSFFYFAHTTLYAMERSLPAYDVLLQDLGTIYTVNGAVMVAGGLAFGLASIRASVLAKWAIVTFTVGVVINLLVSLLPIPDIAQTIGSTLRNIGLIGMGLELLRSSKPNYSDRSN